MVKIFNIIKYIIKTFINRTSFYELKMARRVKKKITGKKKQWINVVAPAMFGGQIIGQAPVYEAEKLLGRKLKVNLMLLTNDIKKQTKFVRLQISEIKNNEAQCIALGYEMSPIALKKVTRRNKNKVNQSFAMLSKDGLKIRIKTHMITQFKTTDVKLKQLQFVLLNEIFEFVTVKKYSEIFSEFLNEQFQMKLRLKLDKIFPLKSFFIYHLSVDSGKKTVPITKAEISKIKVKVTRVVPRKSPIRRNRYFKRRNDRSTRR